MESVKKEEKTELQTRLERNQKGMRELEKKLNNYRKAIESGVDISLVIEPINALKSEKENLEGTNRELKARLENQPRPEAFRFTKTAYDNFSEMIQTVINSGSVDNLRAFLQRFIQKILVYPDRISIIYLPTLIDGFNDPGSDDPYTVSMVPKGGFEPPRGLPTTPSRWRVYQFHHFGISPILPILYFVGAGTAGVWGTSAGADGAGLSLTTEAARRVELKARIREVNINRTATTVVNLVRKPIAPELPKIVWLAPPKAAPISAPFPACKRTIRISAKQTMM